ncbi:hypothetical protein QEJ31_13175 [Pigmentibacter sp. JX0631]|uniref:hypothetical protein n=1 Tax=Pigmentibacter sp. JX0631 TaxID=2976982 RepID=UPI0024698943|nr:hypothetical protein [Pigmentibacter sp. JX0631]WGL59476.1 hypothetical protein QEJ31_13175 [Pigmentibacter sp. JX0631]
MNIKIFFVSILISYHSFSIAKEYKCPDISKGNYTSNINKNGEWNFFATPKNSKTSLKSFLIEDVVVWERKLIEPLQYTDSVSSNLLTCYSYEENYTIHAVLLVPERNCHFKENNIFCCY